MFQTTNQFWNSKKHRQGQDGIFSCTITLMPTYSVLLSLQLRLFSVCVLACILLLLSSAFYALSSLSCFSQCIFLIFLIFLLHIHVQIFLFSCSSFQPGKKGFESYHHPQWICWKIDRTPLENQPPPWILGQKPGKTAFDVPGKMKPLINEMYEIPQCFMITLQ